tara:strand:- start:132 stop:338 length:207 start_codon:yes stop_codon:yes gene_type:complete
MSKFSFDLGQKVQLVNSPENGFVIARAEYVNKCNTYLVRYCAACNQLVESWWDEDALTAFEENAVKAA